MPVVIAILVLLALLAFIGWERRRAVSPISRERIAHGWAPRVLPRWPAFAGISACAIALGVAHWVSPPQPPFTGKLSSVLSVFYEHFGPYGASFMWWSFAALLGLAAVASWLASSKVGGGNAYAER